MEPLFDFPIQLNSKSNSLPTPLQNSQFSPFFVHVLPPLQTPSNSPHHLLFPYSPLPKIHVIGPFSSHFLSTPAPFQLFPPKILRNFFLALPPHTSQVDTSRSSSIINTSLAHTVILFQCPPPCTHRAMSPCSSLPSQLSPPPPDQYMLRYSRIFLTPKEEQKLRSSNKSDLRLLQHDLANSIVGHFLSHHPPLNHLPPHTVPPYLRVLVNKINTKHFHRKGSPAIQPLCLWQIIHCAHFCHLNYSPASHPAPNHDGIYVFDRFPCPDETKTPYLLRRPDPSSSFAPTSSSLTYKNCTFVTQPDGMCIMYLVHGLHSKRHGSAFLSQIPALQATLAPISVPVTTITHPLTSRNGKKGTASHNGVTVFDSSSAPLSRLHASLPNGPLAFHVSLALHILDNERSTDMSRVDGKLCQTLQSVNLRLRFGWGREQTTKYKAAVVGNQKLPSLVVAPFHKCLIHIRTGLMKVMETGSDVVRKRNSLEGKDIMREDIFARRMNAALGHPSSRNNFEYVDIVLSRNCVLPAHLDRKNNHRAGHDHCAVYSFSVLVKDLQYQVAIIMTTRYAVGACLEKIKSNLR